MAENQHSKTVPVSTAAKASRPPSGRKARTKKPDPYTIGNIAGEEAAQQFYERLMERHPNKYGGRLASLILDGLQTPRNLDDPEATKRRGWLVGLCFALECHLYEHAPAQRCARAKCPMSMEDLLDMAAAQASAARQAA